jgi:alkylhydroperoxidase family enzyme
VTQHIAGSANEIRALVPGVLETYRYIDENVLRSGPAEQRLKELCFRYLAEDPEVMDLERFAGRERLALEWTHAIAWDSAKADDGFWERLHAEFSEPELVDLGCAIGFELGQQHWRRTIGLSPRDEPHDATA